MPNKGHVYKNFDTGDEFEFIETSKSSDGKRVVLKHRLKKKGKLVPNHYHVLQEETFNITKGKLFINFDGKEFFVHEGESITFPKNVPHNHYNNTDDLVEYIHTVTPALDFDYLLENIIGLTIDGKMPNGKAGLIQELVTLNSIDSKTYLADIPHFIQIFLMKIVSPIARLFGYRALYKKYSGIEK